VRPWDAFDILFLVGMAWVAFVSIANVLWLRVAGRGPESRPADESGRPKVSVLLPARNEEHGIADCLASLVEQSYGSYEIVVLDDGSTDGTWEIASRFAARHPALVRAVRGRPLPREGWCGKPHAMQQLAAEATGDILMFTDADTVHGPMSVAWAATNLLAHRADLLSGYARQEIRTVEEALIAPAFYVMNAFLLPLALVPHTRASGLSFAIGQMMVFRRAAFEAIGGYAPVADHIGEDVSIARELKRAGFRTVFLDAARHVRCRPDGGSRGAARSVFKNIYDYCRRRPLTVALGAVLAAVVAVIPAFLAAGGLLAGRVEPRALARVAAFLAVWALVLYDRGHRWWVPLLSPLFFLNLMMLTGRATFAAAARRGVVWKARTLR
jgi:chlorobactene glucosyltransferase